MCKMYQDHKDCKRLIEEVNYRQTTMLSAKQLAARGGRAGLGADVRYEDNQVDPSFVVEFTAQFREDGAPTRIDAEKVCKYVDMCKGIEYGKGPNELPVDDRLDGNTVAQDLIKNHPVAAQIEERKRRAKYQAMCHES